MGMFITYRRTGGVFALLAFAGVVVAATVLTVAVAATVLIVAVAVAVAGLCARALRLTSSWHHTVPPATGWPQQTIETRVVHPKGSSDERDLVRTDSDKG